jgi:beta-mannosidase
MRGRVKNISGYQVQPLSAGWEIASCAPGAIGSPSALAAASLDWVATTVPSTAASSLRAAGAWSLDGVPRRFDADDWWYRARFTADKPSDGEQIWLCFDGLATVADVWLNDTVLLSSTSMFIGSEHRVDELLRADNALVIRFRSLDALLRERRPRPRWRAPMVENQQIRWFRSTLLGRTPGWSPPAQAVGPWRGIRLEYRSGVSIDGLRMRADAAGRLEVSCALSALDGTQLSGAQVVLSRNGREFIADLAPMADRVAGSVVVPSVARWWPHTHGDPALYAARLKVRHGADVVEADLGAIGFRSVELNTADNGFAIHVNGAPVFCRGACWTPLDVVSLASTPDALSEAFEQVVDGGMNMLRVGGMMIYEDDAFLDQCDARGVLLWQDFMFANLHYPEEDPGFSQTVTEEVTQQLARMQGRPSLAVLCGNSEGEQQAAMWGAARDQWRSALFHDRIASIANHARPDVPYWPSSTHGGAFPHQGNAGTASYYGVGAYLRPLEDARRAEVRFATECLAFANIPEPQSLAALPGGLGTKVHDPAWKMRTPRDLGAGWDFDDVRDHYVAELFGVDLLQLRYADHERYLAIGRVGTGEVMARVFSEWRRRRSVTRGALMWFLRDLWPGAGWGIIDATGRPKAAWFYLRRALAPVAISLSDEGGNGLAVHVVNDRPSELLAEIELTLYRFGEVKVGSGRQRVALAPSSAIETNAAVLFDDFVDLSYAYRFGPPSHDVVVATLRGAQDEVLGSAYHFVPGLPNGSELDIGLVAEAERLDDGAFALLVRTRRLAQSVTVEADGFDLDDNYFHLAPGEVRRVVLRRAAPASARHVTRCTVRALNAKTAATVSLASTGV